MDWGQQALFIFVINTILIFSSMTILWVINVLTKNMSIVDIGWTLGIFTVALTSFLWGTGDIDRRTLLLFIVSLWAFRLGIHLIFRFIRAKEEDPRYRYLRNKWTNNTELKILMMFYLQGFTILLLTLPFMSISFENESLYATDFLGVVIALIGILGETVADRQLREFKKNHPGKLCRVGLWNRSRHPNYFFEWIFWIGIAIFALQAPFGLSGIFSCGLMLYLLLFVSGVQPTERELAKSKKESFLKYQREVPAFFPRIRNG